MARVPFATVFNVNPDGSVEPRQTTRIGGVTITPGVRLTAGVSLGGIDIAQYTTRNLEITTDAGAVVVTGIY